MSKPTEETKPSEPTDPTAPVDQIDQTSTTNTTTEINSSTTVFTYKKSIEMSEPVVPEAEPVVPAPVPQKTTPTPVPVSTRATNNYAPVSPTKTNYSSSVLNKDVYAAESIYSPQYKSTISPRHTVVSRRGNANNSSSNTLERSYNASCNSMGHSTVSYISDSPISLRPSGTSSQALR